MLARPLVGVGELVLRFLSGPSSPWIIDETGTEQLAS
jgi:hypothetical protein